MPAQRQDRAHAASGVDGDQNEQRQIGARLGAAQRATEKARDLTPIKPPLFSWWFRRKLDRNGAGDAPILECPIDRRRQHIQFAPDGVFGTVALLRSACTPAG